MKQEFSAGIIVYIKNDQNSLFYLLLRSINGNWDLPKGKIEEAENLLQTAQRELLEETGLIATILPDFQQSIHYVFSDTYHNTIDKTVTFFIGEVHNKKVTISSEHIDYLWLTFEDSIKKVTHGNTRQLLELAQETLISRNIIKN